MLGLKISKRVERAVSTLIALALMMCVMSVPAYAAGKSKVTKFEYDGLGRQVKIQIYDDVGASGLLIAETTKEYDGYHNVIKQVQKRVPYDFQDISNTPVAIYDAANGNPYDYEEIIQNYAYEDTTWPTKVTKAYDPRYPTNERFASHNYYNGITGLLDLSLNGKEYCLDMAVLNSAPKAGTYSVQQSGQTFSKQILSFKRCDATAYFYDALGRVTETHQSSNLDIMRWSNPTPYLDRVWLETTYEYYAVAADQKGALKRVINGAAGEALRMFTDFDWDDVGNIVSVTNNGTTGTLGYETTADYDSMRRIIKTSDPEAGETQYTYDDTGRLRGISKLLGTTNSVDEWAITKASYFPSGRLLKVEDPDGDITARYVYDAAGRVDTTTDGEGRVTKTLYYPNGQTKCTIRAYGDPLLQQAYQTMEYAADGQVKSIRPAKASNKDTCARTSVGDKYDTTYTYDGYRRLYQTVYPKRAEDANASYVTTANFMPRGAGHTFTRQLLDEKGQTTTYRTRRNEITKSTYALDGQLATRTTPETYYTYLNYADGRLDHANVYPVINGVTSTAHRRYAAYGYSSLNQPLFESIREYENGVSGSATATLAYYDTAGQMLKLAYEGGTAAPYAAYSYTKTGQMKTARFTSDGNYNNLNYVAFYNYDIAGRKTHAYIGDHSNATPAFGLQAYTYDADGDLKTLAVKWSDPGQSTTAHVGFVYKYDQDASGKITAAFATTPNWRYTPPEGLTETYKGPTLGDPVNSLDQYSKIQITPECPLGATCNAAPHMIQAHDGAGNLTSTGDGRTYTYNSENQLIRAVKTGTGAFDMEYWYDAQGRRSHSIDHLNQTETFHKHWGEMEIGDYDVTRTGGVIPTLIGTGGNAPPNPAKVTGYSAQFHVILGQGVDNRIAYHKVAGDDLSFYLTNHQGSTVAMTDNDGKILSHTNGGRLVYDAYGAEVSGAPITGQPFRYTGRRLDAQTSLYYYRARYYDADTGRFLQTDPIGYEDQMNLYNYVGNDPLNATDPSGEEGEGWMTRWINLGSEKYVRQAQESNKEAATATGIDRINPMRSQRVAHDNLAAGAVLGGEALGNGYINGTILYISVAGGPVKVAPADKVAVGVGLTLKTKQGWSAAQKTQAVAKVNQLDAAAKAGNLVKTNPVRSSTSAGQRYRQAGNNVQSGNDVDHIIDLQLGGADTLANLAPLDMSVNRSFGAQIGNQLSNVQTGTKICSVNITGC